MTVFFSSKKVCIYALLEPETKIVRYVGKTTREPKRRLYEHIRNLDYNTYKTNWIKSLLKDGKEPILAVLETCDYSEWIERERFWIDYYLKNGQKSLTNLTLGGDYGSIPWTVERKKSRKGIYSSLHLGVVKADAGWSAAIGLNGQRVHLGRFDSEEEAAKVFDAVSRYYFKDKAQTNFEGTESYSVETANRLSEERQLAKNKTGYRGVHENSLSVKKYNCLVYLQKNRPLSLGCYSSAKAAARVYDWYCITNNLARILNFPDDKETSLLKGSKAYETRYEEKTSKYPGVYYVSGIKRWHVNFEINGNRRHFGCYLTEEDAAKVHDYVCLEFKLDRSLHFNNIKTCEEGRVLYENRNVGRSVVTSTLRNKRTRLSQGNAYNPRKAHSEYLGVSWNKPKEKYVATIRYQAKTILLATFDSPDRCAYYYDCAALHYFGKNAKTNGIGTKPLTPTELRREVMLEQKKGDTSSYLGVCFQKGNYIASMVIDGKQKEIARFKSEIVAAKVYDAVARFYQDEPITNFDGTSCYDLETARKFCRKIYKSSRSSQYIGICFHKGSGYFIVQFRHDKKLYEIGRSKDEEKAAKVYDALIRNYYPEKQTNFDGTEKLTIEEAKNLLKIKRERTSQYTGVFRTAKGEYSASLYINGATKRIATNLTEIECAKAVDRYILEYNLDKPLNFPELTDVYLKEKL